MTLLIALTTSGGFVDWLAGLDLCGVNALCLL